jgi:chemotaxis signal transduction protein
MDVNEKQRDKYVTFKSGNEYFGLKIEYVNEIIVYQEITEIPESDDYIKGLINLRGKIIPVIDVRVRFKQEQLEYTDRTCIIIVNVNDIVVGLIVEKIAEVVEIKSEKAKILDKVGAAKTLNLNKPYEEMTIEELQEVIIGKMRKNGPVTDRMMKDVTDNTHRGSLVTWAKSF